MSTDLENLIWEFRSSFTMHRVGDARDSLARALALAKAQGADAGTQFTLSVDAATLAQFMGDLPAARRHTAELGGTGLDAPLHRFWRGMVQARQANLQDQYDQAAGHFFHLMTAAESHDVGPVRHPSALTEFALFHAQLGLFPEAIALAESACDRLVRLGSHQEWAAHYLVDLARILVQSARAAEERAAGFLDAPPAGSMAGAAALRRRAVDALDLAVSLRAPGWSASVLARSAEALRSAASDAAEGSDETLQRLQTLTDNYVDSRMLDGVVWHSGELARVHLNRGEHDAALLAISRARAMLPAMGLDGAREQLDFLESVAQQNRGDHRHALQAYQRYARRALERRIKVPTALRDGSLSDLSRRLSGQRARQVVLARQEVMGSKRPARAQGVTVELAAAAQAPALSRAAVDLFTPRENEVVRLLCLGQTNLEIGRDLGMSIYTARNHLSAVCRKLGVNTREQVRAAMLAPTL